MALRSSEDRVMFGWFKKKKEKDNFEL